jgi:hypothetical protein
VEKNTEGDREMCCTYSAGEDMMEPVILRQVLVLETKHHNSDGCTMVGLGNREADPRGKQFSVPASNKQEIVRQE